LPYIYTAVRSQLLHFSLQNLRQPSLLKTEPAVNRILLLLPFLLLLINSCCNCSGEEQTFTPEEKDWIPASEIGDSLVFVNALGDTKTFFVRQKQDLFSRERCAGPCCVCPEDNAAYSDFECSGETIPGSFISEGLTISLIKTNNTFQKSFTWSCPYGNFQDFDYHLDTLTVHNRIYTDVQVKELTVCSIRKIFFSRGSGLIRFDYDDGSWERVN
jgi:hypothetical protein